MCPLCGVKLVAKSDRAQDVFRRFVAGIESCGPYSLAPAKTRVAFVAQVRFASVNRIGDDYIDVHFVLPRAIASPRFSKVERLGQLYVHHLRLRDARDVNRQLLVWLRQAYAEYGQRQWLEKRRPRR
jgi:hypothetical protein